MSDVERDYFPQPRVTPPVPDAETMADAVERAERLRIRIVDHDDIAGACSVECDACDWATTQPHTYGSAYQIAESHNRSAHRRRCVIVMTGAPAQLTSSA